MSAGDWFLVISVLAAAGTVLSSGLDFGVVFFGFVVVIFGRLTRGRCVQTGQARLPAIPL